MEDLRSNSYIDTHMQIHPYSGAGAGAGARPTSDFRSYSSSYPSYVSTQPPISIKELKKGKSSNGSISKSWSLKDPEFQRKKRVASYRAYQVEGKMKGSFRKSFRWIKERYYDMVNGFW